MKTQSIFLALFSLISILLVTSIGFNIYLYQKINKAPDISAYSENKLSRERITEQYTKNESPAKSAKPDQAVKESALKTRVNELEYNLEIAEEDADTAYDQLSEELDKKEEYKNAIKTVRSLSLENNLTTARKTALINSLNVYDPLFDKLNISEEEFQEFKNILADRAMETASLRINGFATGAEGRANMSKVRKVSAEHNARIRDLLGDDQYGVYLDYTRRMREYTDLDNFSATLPPDNNITQEQRDLLVEAMYKGRMAATSEIQSDESLNQQERMLLPFKITKLSNEKGLEAGRSILTPEQYDRYKAFMDEKNTRMEQMMKIRKFMDE